MGDLKKYPTSSKLILSSTTGYISGIALKKLGKLAAFSIGASIIMNVIFQELKTKQFFHVDDEQEETKIDKSVTVFQEGIVASWKSYLAVLSKYDNVLYSGYVGGFLIGLS